MKIVFWGPIWCCLVYSRCMFFCANTTKCGTPALTNFIGKSVLESVIPVVVCTTPLSHPTKYVILGPYCSANNGDIGEVIADIQDIGNNHPITMEIITYRIDSKHRQFIRIMCDDCVTLCNLVKYGAHESYDVEFLRDVLTISNNTSVDNSLYSLLTNMLQSMILYNNTCANPNSAGL